jgi:hypothetical protein
MQQQTKPGERMQQEQVRQWFILLQESDQGDRLSILSYALTDFSNA